MNNSLTKFLDGKPGFNQREDSGNTVPQQFDCLTCRHQFTALITSKVWSRFLPQRVEHVTECPKCGEVALGAAEGGNVGSQLHF